MMFVSPSYLPLYYVVLFVLVFKAVDFQIIFYRRSTHVYVIKLLQN